MKKTLKSAISNRTFANPNFQWPSFSTDTSRAVRLAIHEAQPMVEADLSSIESRIQKAVASNDAAKKGW